MKPVKLEIEGSGDVVEFQLDNAPGLVVLGASGLGEERRMEDSVSYFSSLWMMGDVAVVSKGIGEFAQEMASVLVGGRDQVKC